MFEHPDLKRYINKYYGIYRAEVTDIQDPNKGARIKLTVPSIHVQDPLTGDRATTGWAFPKGIKPIARIPSVGSMVWVEFEGGDLERPIWSPGTFTYFQGEPTNDRHMKGQYDELDNKGGRLDGSMPESQYGGSYSNVESWKVGDNVVELDNTEGRERILIQHSSGTHIEILDDGTVTQYAAGNKRNVVKGGVDDVIYGRYEKDVTGPVIETYQGSHTVTKTKGDEEVVIGDAIYTYNSYNRTSDTEIITITGKRELRVGGSIASAIAGKESKIITETASWIVSNVLGAANPISEAISMHAVNGEVVLKAGPSILVPGTDHSRLRIGMTGIVMKALAQAVLQAPIIRIGRTEATAINPVAKALPLFAWLDTHTHTTVAPGSPTTPPIVPISTISSTVATTALLTE